MISLTHTRQRKAKKSSKLEAGIFLFILLLMSLLPLYTELAGHYPCHACSLILLRHAFSITFNFQVWYIAIRVLYCSTESIVFLFKILFWKNKVICHVCYKVIKMGVIKCISIDFRYWTKFWCGNKDKTYSSYIASMRRGSMVQYIVWYCSSRTMRRNNRGSVS